MVSFFENEIKKFFPNANFITIEQLTQGQASSCLLAKDFIDNGIEWKGEIEMVATRHKLVGFLSNQKNIKCNLMLQYDPNV